MAPSQSNSPDRRPAAALASRGWQLSVLGMAAIAVSHPLVWQSAQPDFCFAPLGLGIVLTAWLGFRIVPLLAIELLVIQLGFRGDTVSVGAACVDGLMTGCEIAVAWWSYRVLAGGARRLDDPRSATQFLLLVPCLVVGCFAGIHVAIVDGLASPGVLALEVVNVWIGRALGVVALAPALLVVGTPWLVHYRFAERDAKEQRSPLHPALGWTTGEVLETVSLSFAAAVLAMALAVLHGRSLSNNWQLWGVLLLVIVWASLRLGLRSGSTVAATATLLGLVVGAALASDPVLLGPLRGNLLAQCCTALLIGASADWIRASEARYRQVVGHIPVVLYSARMLGKAVPGKLPDIEITLVSPAAQQILGCSPDDLVGSYQHWLELIHPADREVMRAALAQLLLQKQPVTCEYRLGAADRSNVNGPPARQAVSPVQFPRTSAEPAWRWLRDTLAPRYGADGLLNGWEGVVEDITEQRRLSHDLRRTGNMLHALVAHLPTGVYFVHGASGQPLLVNARARQLLGQREDLAAGLSHLSTVYRLHRPDGKPYPWEELPVSTALRDGATSMRDDIVVHRPDGRRIPLVTWAAPVELGNQGEADAAVWVLEDLTALRQAEAARRETESRLRVIIDTLAEGLIVQNHKGSVVECNAAACAILGVDAEQLRSWSSLGHDGVCLDKDGRPLSRDELPDRVSLESGQPVRGIVLGLAPRGFDANANPPSAVRWILANSMPIQSADKRGQRVVTTFSDITPNRQAQEALRRSDEPFRDLVQQLPAIVLQFDHDGTLLFQNRAAEKLKSGHDEPLRDIGLLRALIHADDWPAFEAMLSKAREGDQGQMEFRFQTADDAERVGYAIGQPRRSGGVTVLIVEGMGQRRPEAPLGKL